MDNYIDTIKRGDDEFPIVDTISGYMKHSDHGEIAEGDEGYVTGDDVYNALGEIEAALAAL